MKVLQEYKEVLWDNIEQLGLEDDEIAQAMLKASEADKFRGGYFSTVENCVDVGDCELTGEFGWLAEVEWVELPKKEPV